MIYDLDPPRDLSREQAPLLDTAIQNLLIEHNVVQTPEEASALTSQLVDRITEFNNEARARDAIPYYRQIHAKNVTLYTTWWKGIFDMFDIKQETKRK